MSGLRAALRYAKATLSFAQEQKNEAQVNEDMLLIAQTIDESAELQWLLNSPVLKLEIKKAALKEIFEKKVSATSMKVVELLSANKRLSLLGDVAKKYTVIFDELKGIEVAKVTTAIPLTPELTNRVLEKVKQLTGKVATIENNVDSTIIGGFILRIADVQYDASIANKLQALKREFKNKSLV